RRPPGRAALSGRGHPHLRGLHPRRPALPLLHARRLRAGGDAEPARLLRPADGAARLPRARYGRVREHEGAVSPFQRRQPPAIEADFVIVGAGSAGCALAYRLSEDGRHKVAIVEYGGSDFGPLIQMPSALSIPMNMARYDWGFSSEP